MVKKLPKCTRLARGKDDVCCALRLGHRVFARLMDRDIYPYKRHDDCIEHNHICEVVSVSTGDLVIDVPMWRETLSENKISQSVVFNDRLKFKATDDPRVEKIADADVRLRNMYRGDDRRNWLVRLPNKEMGVLTGDGKFGVLGGENTIRIQYVDFEAMDMFAI